MGRTLREVRITDDCKFMRICEFGLGVEPGSQVAGEQVSKDCAVLRSGVQTLRIQIDCELIRIGKYQHRPTSDTGGMKPPIRRAMRHRCADHTCVSVVPWLFFLSRVVLQETSLLRQSSGAGWPSLTAVLVWDHLWPRRATFFPPRMDHLFSVDHLFPTLYRDLIRSEIFGWWPPCSGVRAYITIMIRLRAPHTQVMSIPSL